MSYTGGKTGASGHAVTLVPPCNFGPITNHIYRSAYPTEANVPYLRHIGIRTVVLLSIEALPTAVAKALRETPEMLSATASVATASQTPVSSVSPSTRGTSGGQQVATTFSMESVNGSREIVIVELADMNSWRVDSLNANDDFSQRDVLRALDFAVDAQWHPLLFCCPTGELQTSVVTGCIRRYQGWSLTSIYGECELFATLQTELRSSLMTFIEAWEPEEYPISMTEIVQRNWNWAKELAQQAHQQRRKQRRMLRHLNQGGNGMLSLGRSPGHGSAHHHHHHSHAHFFRMGHSGGTSVAIGSSHGSDGSMTSSGDESDAPSDHSSHSSVTYGAVMGTADLRNASAALRTQKPHFSVGAANDYVTEEGITLSSSGRRPPSAWQRRHPATMPGGRNGSPGPTTPGGVAGTAAAGEEGNFCSARAGQPTFGGSLLPTFQDRCLASVIFAPWFEEARRRNPLCCVDVETPPATDMEASSLGDSGGANISEETMPKSREEKPRVSFPRSTEEVKENQALPPHLRYAGVRNPPVLDERSTFTKQSIVDEDDD